MSEIGLEASIKDKRCAGVLRKALLYEDLRQTLAALAASFVTDCKTILKTILMALEMIFKSKIAITKIGAVSNGLFSPSSWAEKRKDFFIAS